MTSHNFLNTGITDNDRSRYWYKTCSEMKYDNNKLNVHLQSSSLTLLHEFTYTAIQIFKFFQDSSNRSTLFWTLNQGFHDNDLKAENIVPVVYVNQNRTHNLLNYSVNVITFMLTQSDPNKRRTLSYLIVIRYCRSHSSRSLLKNIRLILLFGYCCHFYVDPKWLH